MATLNNYRNGREKKDKKLPIHRNFVNGIDDDLRTVKQLFHPLDWKENDLFFVGKIFDGRIHLIRYQLILHINCHFPNTEMPDHNNTVCEYDNE